MSSDEIARIPLIGVTPFESFDSPLDRRSEVYRHQARLHPVAPQPPPQPLVTIPNVLTFLRLILVPVLIIVWYSRLEHAALASALVFVTASLTDWLDGYLARKLHVATVFGAFLDPVADKIMVSTALILLTTSPPLPLTQYAIVSPVIIIICREITMSALREWAAAAGGSAHKAVKVNSLGKWKTALQMTSMSIMLFCRDPVFVPSIFTGVNLLVKEVVLGSWILLWLSALLALWSLGTYMSNVWTHFVYPTKQH